MIDTFLCTLNYVVRDPFFWPSMAFTVMVAIFIGAIIYNGDIEQVKKALLFLGCYVGLLLTVNVSRVIPTVADATHPERPFGSAVTIVLVTFFYLLGMALGVLLVRGARKR